LVGPAEPLVLRKRQKESIGIRGVYLLTTEDFRGGKEEQ